MLSFILTCNALAIKDNQLCSETSQLLRRKESPSIIHMDCPQTEMFMWEGGCKRMTTRGPAGFKMEEDHHRAASTSCVLHGGGMFKPQRTSSTLKIFLCTVRSETKSGNPFNLTFKK